MVSVSKYCNALILGLYKGIVEGVIVYFLMSGIKLKAIASSAFSSIILIISLSKNPAKSSVLVFGTEIVEKLVSQSLLEILWLILVIINSNAFGYCEGKYSWLIFNL